MQRLHPGLIAACLFAGAAAAPLAVAQEAETFIYSTYFYCDVAQQERADAIYEQVDKPANDAALPARTLGRSGIAVSALGFGGAPLGDLYAVLDDAAAIAAVEAAARVGITLFDTAPLDPASYAGAAVLFVLVAAVACGVPAWRATRIDPVTVLRV